MDTIQINKFSNLHNGQTIIFCKTDFLIKEFEHIQYIPNSIILISGNSDYIIDEKIFKLAPKNIKKWYAQNALINNEIIETLPLGIENLLSSFRDGHGVGYDRVLIKEFEIKNQSDKEPENFIYSNFNINTNPPHRNLIKQICEETDFIDWEEPNLSVSDFFRKIKNYEAVVCAQGNDAGDNHRIYETLYMGRIPITFNKKMYECLHYRFPVVLIENINDLQNYDLMRNKINKAKNKKWEKEILDVNYWINKINNSI